MSLPNQQKKPIYAYSTLEKIGIGIVRYKFLSLFLIVVLSVLSTTSILKKASKGLPVDFSPQAIFIDG